jgi:VIT1/CCC1 family predicted Fe2+/Mn2+ transporter
LPYVYFSLTSALWFSILFSILALFIVGIVSAKLSKISVLRRGLTMASLGAAAIVIGVLVGKFMKIG